jgi:RNA-directed DNA polymerase
MDLTTTDENQVKTCQTSGNGTFTKENISACVKYVRSIQRRLDKAVANDDKPNIRWYTHLLSKKSRSVKILAVHRICTNDGRKTAGVDGVSIPKERGQKYAIMERLLNEIDINSTPQPILRVYIPKPNGKKRPLGIPTIKDRIAQEVIRQSIEPICESHFMPCSYGFRPKRGCHDAIADLFLKLGRKKSRRWIIEGDVANCFGTIKHDHIITTLQNWNVPSTITSIIEKMLKANIMEELTLTPSSEGTPQGGVISPMLANVALTCLDKEVKTHYEYRGMNPIVRYADDFVIVTRTKEEAETIKSYIKEYLKEVVNLELSEEKTHITQIDNGFDFLGFNIRKYGEKLLIKPSKESIHNIKRKVGTIIRILRSHDVTTLIRRLNPIIKGWGNYYRHVVSNSAYHEIDGKTWTHIKKWGRKQNRTKWVQTYLMEKESKRLRLHDKKTGVRLVDLCEIPIKRFIKIRSDMRVYDVNAKDYWERKEYMNARDSIYGSDIMTKLFRAQKGKCDYCGESLTDAQIRETQIHKHHMKPRSEGGNWKLNNLRLLHNECHRSLHSMYSRKEMANLIDKGIDYLRLMKPAQR